MSESGSEGVQELRWRTGSCEQPVLVGGSGPPLLVLHDEMGYPGWLRWQRELSARRTIMVPLMPGFGRAPRVEWIASMRDQAVFYANLLRAQNLAPVDVIGFSLGGWLAAEMAAGDPALFRRMVLVAPLGVRPPQGRILDVFDLSQLDQLAATVRDPAATPEFTEIYGGAPSPEQVEGFDDARAQMSRLAWQPYLHNPSLPHLLSGITRPPATLLIHGEADGVVPVSASQAYQAALAGARLTTIPAVGHRPEIEDTAAFVAAVNAFLVD